MITSKRVVLEWTLACLVSSIEEWRGKESVQRQEVEKEAILEINTVKEHDGFEAGEEEWEHLLLYLHTMNLGVESAWDDSSGSKFGPGEEDNAFLELDSIMENRQEGREEEKIITREEPVWMEVESSAVRQEELIWRAGKKRRRRTKHLRRSGNGLEMVCK